MSLDVLSFSLQAFQERNQVLAANIANANTPGYQAERVSFQSSLDNALSSGGSVQATLQPEGLPSRASGNNVNLATEFSELERNDLETRAVSEALTSSFSILKTSIEG
jgi:flagellar basal-body rod protein FlgB